MKLLYWSYPVKATNKGAVIGAPVCAHSRREAAICRNALLGEEGVTMAQTYVETERGRYLYRTQTIQGDVA